VTVVELEGALEVANEALATTQANAVEAAEQQQAVHKAAQEVMRSSCGQHLAVLEAKLVGAREKLVLEKKKARANKERRRNKHKALKQQQQQQQRQSSGSSDEVEARVAQLRKAFDAQLSALRTAVAEVGKSEDGASLPRADKKMVKDEEATVSM
jgi:hypothetical protein